MTREKIILKHIDKKDFGLEIGPSLNPIASKKDGYKVHTLDHLNKEGLIEKYKDHGVDTNIIEEVDFIWQGETFLELTKKPKFYSWIIASHVIEHTTDLVRFINSCAEVLSEDGVISLAIPDKRFCFDYYRPLTGLSQIVDAYFSERKIHSEGTIAEYFAMVVRKNNHIAWADILPGEFQMAHSVSEGKTLMNEVHLNRIYLDLHAWCFVPSSFRLLIQDLFDLGLISVKEVDFNAIGTGEFFMTLSRNGQGMQENRIEVFKSIQFELQDKYKIEEFESKKAELESKIEELESLPMLKYLKILQKVIFKIKFYSRKIKQLFRFN